MGLALGFLENMVLENIYATTFWRVCTYSGADPESEVRKRLAA